MIMTDGELIMRHISTYVDRKIELNELKLRPGQEFLDPVVFPPSFIARGIENKKAALKKVIEVERTFIAGFFDDMQE
jgi:hypothetical protein